MAVGFYMTQQEFNSKPDIQRAKVPKHKSMTLIHNYHFTKGLSVMEAIEQKLDGYEADDWINIEEKQKAIDDDNHWMIRVFPKTRKKYYVYSASDVARLLQFVADLSHWRDGEQK